MCRKVSYTVHNIENETSLSWTFPSCRSGERRHQDLVLDGPVLGQHERVDGRVIHALHTPLDERRGVPQHPEARER